jgi:pilus assembly protein FimV
MVLFCSNPEAFIGGNINRLKAGAVLGVPSPDDMLAQPLGEARADFFDEAKGIHRVMPMPQDRLRIALKPQEEQLEAGVSKRAARGGEVEQVRTDLMMVRETSESNRQETEDLRSRIRELESQLTDIRQLLKLKSDQLAQIQAGQSEGPADKPPLVPRTEEQASSTQMEAPIEDVSAPSPVAPRVAQGALSTPPMIAGPEIPSAAERSDVANIQEAVHKQEAPPAVPAQISQQLPEKAPLAKRISPQRILPDISFGSALDQILGNPTMLGYGGAMLLILLSLGWLLLRRRRGTEVEFPEESGLLVEGEGGTTTVEHKVPSMARGDVAKDTSFISDFSPSDIDALQEEETGEVDPAAEADVYIAYGRYQQAENLIKQALDKTPERPDLKRSSWRSTSPRGTRQPSPALPRKWMQPAFPEAHPKCGRGPAPWARSCSPAIPCSGKTWPRSKV